jgi:hypothetical protein
MKINKIRKLSYSDLLDGLRKIDILLIKIRKKNRINETGQILSNW